MQVIFHSELARLLMICNSQIKGDGGKKCLAPEAVILQNSASFKKIILFVEYFFLCFQSGLLTLQMQLLFFFCVFVSFYWMNVNIFHLLTVYNLLSKRKEK